MWRDTLIRTAWLTAGSALGRFLPYMVLIGLGRILSTTDFATVAVCFAWSGVAANLSISGLATLTTQRLALLTAPSSQGPFIKHISGLGLCLVALLCVSLILIGNDAIDLAFGRVVHPSALPPAMANGVAWSLTLLALAILNGLHLARVAALVLSIGGMLQGLGMMAGYFLSGGISGLLWGLAIGSNGALVWALWQIVKALRLAPTRPPQSTVNPYKQFWSALAWNSLAAACVVPVTLIASSFLTHRSNGAQQLAAFHALEQLHQLAIFIPGIVGQALLPTLTVHLHGDPERGTRRMVLMALTLSLAGMGLGLLLGWDAQWLHRLVGNRALEDALATRWMLLHAGLALSMTLIGNALLARNLHAVASCMNLAWAGVFLTLAWRWVDAGAGGIQLARLCASVLLVAATGALLWHLSKPNPQALRQ